MRNLFLRLFVVLSFLLPAIAFGQYYSITCDSQNPDEQFVIDNVFSGNTPFLRSYHYDDGVAIDLTPWSMQFYYSYGQYDTNGGVTINGTVSSNCATYLGATNVFFQAYDRYYFSIKGTHSSGYVKTFARGKMIQDYDPATDTNLVTEMGEINMNWWTNNVGVQVESNRLNIAVLWTGKVDRTAFDGTNVIFEARVAANEAFNVAQALSNAAYEVRIASNETFRITTQPATNAYFEAAKTNQAGTNVYLEAAKVSQAATNAYFESAKTNQAATNLYFETAKTNQAATNVLLRAAIDAVGTGTWSLAVLTDGSRSANYLNIVNTN